MKICFFANASLPLASSIEVLRDAASAPLLADGHELLIVGDERTRWHDSGQ